MRNFHDKTPEELTVLEQKYDFIPDETPAGAAEKSLNSLCRIQTRDIATCRRQKKPTTLYEKKLREYRDYAFRHYL